MKKCTKCNRVLNLDSFTYRNKSKNKKHSWCRRCMSDYKKEYTKRPEVIKKIKIRNSDPETLRKRREYKNKRKDYFNEITKEWRLKNKNHREEYRLAYKIRKKEIHKTRYYSDPEYKIKYLLRRRLHKALTGRVKVGSAVKDLGCSVDFLRQYLESKFQKGMTWDNYGYYGWHIDHIIPLSSFDLTDREQFLKACNYTNLQPLWAKDNLSKSNKMPK